MKKGFTLLETLSIIGIISTLVVISVPAFQMIQKNVSLKNYSKEIASVLKTLQNDVITSQGGITHGVYFEQNRYILCEDDCSPSNFINFHEINNGIEIISGVNEAIAFNRLTGETTDNADKEIIIGFPGGQQKIIQVDNNGKISIL